MLKNRCFIDCNNQIWIIDNQGKSSNPYELKIDGSVVALLEPPDGEMGRQIVHEYTLWPSLISLATAIESELPSFCDIEALLDNLPQCQPSTESLEDQMAALKRLAVVCGLHSAAEMFGK